MTYKKKNPRVTFDRAKALQLKRRLTSATIKAAIAAKEEQLRAAKAAVARERCCRCLWFAPNALCLLVCRRKCRRPPEAKLDRATTFGSPKHKLNFGKKERKKKFCGGRCHVVRDRGGKIGTLLRWDLFAAVLCFLFTWYLAYVQGKTAKVQSFATLYMIADEVYWGRVRCDGDVCVGV